MELAAEYELDLLDCRYGKMLAFRSDQVIGRSLRMYGEWAQHELSYLRSYVEPGTVVIDVGAHIGTHTLPFSRWVGPGKVLAIEPQPIVASVLVTNCLLNGCTNVAIIEQVCSDKTGKFVRGLPATSNFGGMSFIASSGIVSAIADRLRYRKSQKGWRVSAALDDLPGDDRVSLVKIDAEGMELQILRGAVKLLRKHRPVVFCEQNDERFLMQIVCLLEGLGYALYWLETHQFNLQNFRRERENVWWRTETGLLALPDRMPARSDLRPIERSDLKLRTFLNARAGTSVALDD